MIQKKYENRQRLSPEEIVPLLQGKLASLKNVFSFQKVDEVHFNGQIIKFGFITKLGTIIKGNLTFIDDGCESIIDIIPNNAKFIDFITAGLNKGILEILS